MNRCAPRPLRFALAGLLLASATLSPALSQTLHRAFPPKVQRGQLVVVQPPEVRLDGKPARLSPGSRIRSTANALVLSAGLVGQNLTVNYTLDGMGQLHEVWILTAAEAATRPGPARAGALPLTTAPGPSGNGEFAGQ